MAGAASNHQQATSSEAKWTVDTTSTPGVLRFTFRGRLSAHDMETFVIAHNRAVDSLQGRDYRVWVDLREMQPLSPEAAAVMERAKRYSAARPNFRGSAVLVAGATVALQHRRTSATGGVIDKEFISSDEEECRRFLTQVYRKTSG